MLHPTPEHLSRAVPVTTPTGKMWAEQEHIETAPASQFRIKRNRCGFPVWAWLIDHSFGEASTPSHIGKHNNGASYVQRWDGYRVWALTGVRVGT